ncbi:hypothetical protein IFM89_010582 [Coptis chinensis]|uniref:Uncharacterized protein n=1 Tax=Coptis chinensis TaxID=261450 RepID=A0A835IL54_9MAGN|nr:hypothetical protein IFM89_010582 [Coptis chinensis]
MLMEECHVNGLIGGLVGGHCHKIYLEKSAMRQILRREYVARQRSRLGLHVLLGEDSDEYCKILLHQDEGFNPWNCDSNIGLFMGGRKKALDIFGKECHAPYFKERIRGTIEILAGLIAAQVVSSIQIAEDAHAESILINRMLRRLLALSTSSKRQTVQAEKRLNLHIWDPMENKADMDEKEPSAIPTARGHVCTSHPGPLIKSPLHHQHLQHHQQSPPPLVTSAPVTPLIKSLSHAGSSPSGSWASAASPTPSSSRSNDTRSLYSSTQNLQELDNSDGCTYKFVFEDEDEGENDNVNEDENGDQMIDVKAKEFIANFYEQMRIQQLDNTNEKIRKH